MRGISPTDRSWANFSTPRVGLIPQEQAFRAFDG
jgi:hypothetical protein